MKEIAHNKHTNLNPDNQLLIRSLIPNQVIDPDDFEDLDSAALLNTLESHRLTSLFCLTAKRKSFLSPPLQSLLDKCCASKRFRMLALVSELCRVIKQCDQAKIETIVLKGPALSQQYYCDYTVRECNDLDILVKPDDVQAAYEILLTMGYKLTETLWNSPKQKFLYHSTYHHYNLYNAGNNMMIELHWRLYASNRVDISATVNIWSRLIVQKLGGVNIRSLSNFDTFIYLSVHGGSHQWKRLFWVQDIVRIIEKEGEEFVEDAYKLSITRGVKRYVLEGCYLANILFNASLPQSVQNAIRQDKRIEELSAMSIFAMNDATSSDQNPVASWKNLLLAKEKLMIHYRTTYYLGGWKAIGTSINRFFINPNFWRVYSFSDSFFVLNYLAAPFLWAYTVLNKSKG